MLSHFRHVQLFAALWVVACQAPLSLEFSRQEYWSEFPCPLPGDLPDQRLYLRLLWLLHCRQILLPQATAEDKSTVL